MKHKIFNAALSNFITVHFLCRTQTQLPKQKFEPIFFFPSSTLSEEVARSKAQIFRKPFSLLTYLNFIRIKLKWSLMKYRLCARDCVINKFQPVPRKIVKNYFVRSRRQHVFLSRNLRIAQRTHHHTTAK